MRPPNLREAQGAQTCANCTYYNAGAQSHGTCAKYGDYGVDADDTCDSWEASKPMTKESKASASPAQSLVNLMSRMFSKSKADASAPLTLSTQKELGGFLVTDEKGGQHLPTTVDGLPDAHHMGMAWAALHGGLMGNKYSGPDKDKAIAKLSAMYHAQNLTPPSAHSASKEFANEFSIFKQSDGKYRWLGVTSSGFRDRDKQLVTSDALAADVTRMNSEQARLGLSIRKEVAEGLGELSWWHVMLKDEDPQTLYPGVAIDIANCDVSEMHGVSNVESGIFYDDAVGARMLAAQKELGFSREFFYPASEPDAQGNFNRIHTYRRTILPASRASNLMSAETLSIQKESKENKMSKLKELVGDEAYQSVLTRVAQKELELERAGVEKKEVSLAHSHGKESHSHDGGDEVHGHAGMQKAYAMADAEDKKEPPEKKGEKPDAEDERENKEPAAAKKEAVAALTLADVDARIAVAFKEFASEFVKIQGAQVASAQKERETIAEDVTALKAMVKELWGDAPKSITSGYHPSDAAHNILDPKGEKIAAAKKALTPIEAQMKATPMGEFALWMTSGSEGMEALKRNGQ